MALLFVDVLGTKQEWMRGGRSGAEAVFRSFERAIVSALRKQPEGPSVSGGVESDSAALQFAGTKHALEFARALYLSTFLAHSRNERRMWLRGVLVADGEGTPLRQEQPLGDEFPRLRMSAYSAPLLDAISLERSGFKGMRLLVDDRLIDSALERSMRIPVGSRARYLHPLVRLKHSVYPARVPEGFRDFLWMAPPETDAWNEMHAKMAERLRWAASDPDEMQHAAATQVMFHEWAAISRWIVERP